VQLVEWAKGVTIGAIGEVEELAIKRGRSLEGDVLDRGSCTAAPARIALQPQVFDLLSTSSRSSAKTMLFRNLLRRDDPHDRPYRSDQGNVSYRRESHPVFSRLGGRIVWRGASSLGTISKCRRRRLTSSSFAIATNAESSHPCHVTWPRPGLEMVGRAPRDAHTVEQRRKINSRPCPPTPCGWRRSLRGPPTKSAKRTPDDIKLTMELKRIVGKYQQSVSPCAC
jgi:hypothetical protein